LQPDSSTALRSGRNDKVDCSTRVKIYLQT